MLAQCRGYSALIIRSREKLAEQVALYQELYEDGGEDGPNKAELEVRGALQLKHIRLNRN